MNGELLTYKSSGKFLITAEYLILKGATGLALPLKHGQTLTVLKNSTQVVHWKSKVHDDIWFDAKFVVDDFRIIHTNQEEVARVLQNVLTQARILNPHFITTGAEATIAADFNLAWGLGSSSTLINNLALWAEVNPYSLLEKTFGGSGYDIACAGAKGPLTYCLTETGRIVKEVPFQPGFSDHIFFVYLGKKMNSRTGMSYFKEKARYTQKEITEINQITDQIITCKSLSDFENLLNRHEHILSAILQMPTVKTSHFNDYGYSIKSMGAWGGDFVLVTGENLEQVKNYFNRKGLDTIIPYQDMVLS
jgi:mevalonate kinase